MSLGAQPFAGILEAIQARSPTPGGGAVAALAGSLGAALASMTIKYSRPGGSGAERVQRVLETVDAAFNELRGRLLELADADVAAYARLRAARRAAQVAGEAGSTGGTGPTAVEEARRDASEVPLRCARLCRDGLELLRGVRQHLNVKLASDRIGAACLLRSAVRLAVENVRANEVGPPGPRLREAEAILARAASLEEELAAR